MPVTLIVNPSAGRGGGLAHVETIARRLAPLGTVTPVFAASVPQLTAAARAAAAAGHIIVVAGGDGTVHHAVNALAGMPSTMGIVPSGRGNDLARALGLPLEVEAAAAQLARGRARPMDLAEVNGRLLCTVGGTGLVAGSTADVSRWSADDSPLCRPVRWIGGNTYLVSAAVRVLFGNSSDAAHVAGEGPHGRWTWEGRTHAILIANQRHMGEGLRLPITSADDDGVLDVCIVPQRSRLSLVTKLVALKTGRSLGADVLRVERATTVRVELEHPSAFAADGELCCEDRVFAVSVRPSALHVLV